MHRASLFALAALALAPAAADAATRWTRDFTGVTGWHVGAYPRTTGDINGDGYDDLVGFGHGGVQVMLSSGVGLAPASIWHPDFGQGAGGWRVGSHLRMVGDVNGDGLDDIVGFGSAAVLVALSTGDGFGPTHEWIHDFGLDQGYLPLYHDRVVGDVDGDGRDDVVVFGDDAVLVTRSTGAAFGAIETWSHQMIAWEGWRSTHNARLLGDVDGDGLDDVVAFNHWGTLIMRSTGSAFAPAYYGIEDFGYVQRGLMADVPRTIADVDGDGRVDVVAFTADGVLVARSNGYGFDPPTRWVDSFGAQTGWSPDELRVLGDIDGDGRADVVGFATDEVRVATARDGVFDDTYEAMTGGEYVIRFQQLLGGKCLTTDGDQPVVRACDGDGPRGWIVADQADGTYQLSQRGRCLDAPDHLADGVVALGIACGGTRARWFVERARDGGMRLRSVVRDRCLRVAGHDRGEGAPLRLGACDASDELRWTPVGMRPRTLVTGLRAVHSGKCLSTTGDNRVVQWNCDGYPHQQLALTDDGDGTLHITTAGTPGRGLAISSTEQGWPVNAMPHLDGSPWEHFALRDLGGGEHLIVSKHSGHCIDVRGSGDDDGAEVLSYGCHGGPNQRWVITEAATTAPMEFSLQNVGGADGTRVVIAGRETAYVSDDPRLVIAFARRVGQGYGEASVRALLSAAQAAVYEGGFDEGVDAWRAPLPHPINAEAKLISVSGDYAVGIDGADVGVEGAVLTGTYEVAGTMHTEVQLLSAEARVTMRTDGVALSPDANVVAGEVGLGDPDGSYAGIGGGLGSRGFSVAAKWGHNGQYGVTVPLGVASVDLYIAHDHAISSVNFANDIGAFIAFGAVDAFDSAYGWSAGAWESASQTVSNIANGIANGFSAVGDAICSFFGC